MLQVVPVFVIEKIFIAPRGREKVHRPFQKHRIVRNAPSSRGSAVPLPTRHRSARCSPPCPLIAFGLTWLRLLAREEKRLPSGVYAPPQIRRRNDPRVARCRRRLQLWISKRGVALRPHQHAAVGVHPATADAIPSAALRQPPSTGMVYQPSGPSYSALNAPSVHPAKWPGRFTFPGFDVSRRPPFPSLLTDHNHSP